MELFILLALLFIACFMSREVAMKKFILIFTISLFICVISNCIFYYCVGDIIDWLVGVLSWLSAIGIFAIFKGNVE